jgi:hypothetical protein
VRPKWHRFAVQRTHRRRIMKGKIICTAAALFLSLAVSSAPANAQFGFGGGGGGEDMMTQMAPMLEMMKAKMGKRRFAQLMQTMGPMMEGGGGGMMGGMGGMGMPAGFGGMGMPGGFGGGDMSSMMSMMGPMMSMMGPMMSMANFGGGHRHHRKH